MPYPGLTGRRLWREFRERGYEGGYTAVTDVLRDIRPAPLPFEVRFETSPGDQAQVDFARCRSSRMNRRSRASSGYSHSCSVQSGQFDTREETLAPVCATRLTLTAQTLVRTWLQTCRGGS